MQLKDLLNRVSILNIVGSTNIDVFTICFDSRDIKNKSLFIAIRGLVADGHKYIKDAIKNGSIAIIVEQIPNNLVVGITYVQVHKSNIALGIIASNFYSNPAKKIKLIGVTGTNGKTTIVNLLYQLFTLLGNRVGMISTIENRVIDRVFPSTHTTPDPLQINYLLNAMVEKGCEYCFMEVSSHALDQARVYGINFAGGIFTNLSQDHLDYHNTFSEYRDVKKTFFDSLCKDAFALANKDDKNALKMLESSKAKKFYYSLKSFSDYRCKVIENQFEGMLLKINNIDVWVKLIGEFNAYNILSVYSVANQFGFKDSDVFIALSMLNPVEGRFEVVKNDSGITGVVDYAHTDDALKNVLKTINSIRKNAASLITIVGCGGDRDKSKRSLMTKAACDLSTQVIVTSDNPRSENPEDIINDMIYGLNSKQSNKVLAITDRRQAIMAAGKMANKNDVILLAGKGHEKYQEIKGKKILFDDMKELKRSLNIILK